MSMIRQPEVTEVGMTNWKRPTFTRRKLPTFKDMKKAAGRAASAAGRAASDMGNKLEKNTRKTRKRLADAKKAAGSALERITKTNPKTPPNKVQLRL